MEHALGMRRAWISAVAIAALARTASAQIVLEGAFAPAVPALPAALSAPAAAPAALSPAAIAPSVFEAAPLGSAPAAAAPEADRAEAAAPSAVRSAAAAVPAAVRPEGSRFGSAEALFDGALTRAQQSERMARVVIPAWASEELPVVSRLLGRPLDAQRRAAILARTNVWVYRWHSHWTYEVSGGLPDGHYDPRFGIRLMLKRGWRRLKDPETHFRVLMAHEYGHWLQNEGVLTQRLGVEVPSVAIELLRGVELVGLDGLKAGRVGFIHRGALDAFESGRRWAQGDMADATALMYRGILGGAAYQVGVDAGRPEAAWEFLRLVAAERDALSAREAYARVVGRPK